MQQKNLPYWFRGCVVGLIVFFLLEFVGVLFFLIYKSGFYLIFPIYIVFLFLNNVFHIGIGMSRDIALILSVLLYPLIGLLIALLFKKLKLKDIKKPKKKRLKKKKI